MTAIHHFFQGCSSFIPLQVLGGDKMTASFIIFFRDVPVLFPYKY